MNQWFRRFLNNTGCIPSPPPILPHQGGGILIRDKMNFPPPCGEGKGGGIKARGILIWVVLLGLFPLSALGAVKEPITMSVVVVNPSVQKTQVVPVRIDLPKEVTPKDVLDAGGLNLEYDESRENYYVYKEGVELAPKKTRVFEVILRDVWFIPQEQLDSLKDYTKLILGRLKDTEYYNTAKPLAETIVKRLDEVTAMQNDETLSRKSYIGAYRLNLQAIGNIKEQLARLEKILATAGGPLAPEMLAKTKIKGEEPSKTMTWILIFVIIIFVGFLAAAFFFTWHGQTRWAKEELLSAKREAFPVKEKSSPENNKDSNQT